jgi:hypothetical protein
MSKVFAIFLLGLLASTSFSNPILSSPTDPPSLTSQRLTEVIRGVRVLKRQAVSQSPYRYWESVAILYYHQMKEIPKPWKTHRVLQNKSIMVQAIV